MSKTQTKKVAVIEFEKFSVAQLPELNGKKEEIKGIIEANPIVEIVDNSTYELAKKSRTAVRSLRTSLENEQKTVKKKIKEYVLDVVDAEYDTLVLGVKSAEALRQNPITAWEDKKEQERLEKVRLEELRVKQIKEAIQTFKDAWIDNVNHLLFKGIDGFNEMFESYSAKFDRSQLAEFEVLFDDTLLVIRQLADSKIKTLTEQEQIGIDNLLIQEKNEESKLINNWQLEWNTVIDCLKFQDISSINSRLVESILISLKHYRSEYEEIYTSTEKRLNSQIELISKAETQRIEREKFEAEQKAIAEKQRIAQEKFQKEKAEFEAKQLEAKFQERKKFLVDEDYWRIYLLAECGESEWTAESNLKKFSDEEFESFKLAVIKSKELVVAIENTTQEVELEESAPYIKNVDPKDTLPLGTTDKIDEIANNDSFVYTEQIRVHDEEDVHEVAVTKTNFGSKDVDVLDESSFKEVTWESIQEDFLSTSDHKDNLSEIDVYFVFEWLSKNYNIPTKKQ